MTDNILLSICIPTYNFGATIGETLDSLINQNLENVEIIVLDGGSNDNTFQVVDKRKSICSKIIYINQGYKGGIDNDIATAVSYAKGKFCWLFSADDVMKPKAVDNIIQLLNLDYDIYLCEQTICDLHLNPVRSHPIFKNINTPYLFDFKNKEQKKSYFKNAITTEAFFSYLAGPIFKKELWDIADKVIPKEFNNTCWGLAGRLLTFINNNNLKIYYLCSSLINKRAGIDSFMDKGIVHRLSITIDGFNYISTSIFGSSSFETNNIRRVIRNENFFKLRNLLSIKYQLLNSNESSQIPKIHKVVFNLFKNSGFLNFIQYLVFISLNKNLLRAIKYFKNLK